MLALLYLGFVAITSQAAGIRNLVNPPDRSGPQISARLWTPCASPPKPIGKPRNRPLDHTRGEELRNIK
jgi:hypothetical protein